jgi:hypothetical protein
MNVIVNADVNGYFVQQCIVLNAHLSDQVFRIGLSINNYGTIAVP